MFVPNAAQVTLGSNSPSAALWAGGLFEPKVLDAADCVNVRFSTGGQKRDKTKGSFAEGLWYKILQRFRLQQRP